MARLALVSRNPAMSMALSATDHSVVEVRPAQLEDWLNNRDDVGVDALILDLGSPATAGRVIGDLRVQRRWTPALVVVGNEAEATQSDVSRMPGVDVLALPLTPERLQAAVEAVLRLPRAAPNLAAEPLLDDVPALQSDDLPNLMDLSSVPSIAGPTTEPIITTRPVPVPLPEPQPMSEQEPEELPPGLSVAAAPTAPYEHTESPTRRERRRRAAEPTTPLRLDPTEPPFNPAARPGSPNDPVALLLLDADARYTLNETAQVIVEDAVLRSSADAGALLVPDGAVWRVAAGVALRPLEHRLQLTSESWLVQQIADAGKGILVEDSDVARLDLRGAPLASHTHLMAVPVPQVGAILLLARDRNETFTEQSLGALAGLADEAGDLLQSAIDLRTLARALARHVDSSEAPAQ
jgi:CheY-like chemotaxis protein